MVFILLKSDWRETLLPGDVVLVVMNNKVSTCSIAADTGPICINVLIEVLSELNLQ
jgi:hypothetical protein